MIFGEYPGLMVIYDYLGPYTASNLWVISKIYDAAARHVR